MEDVGIARHFVLARREHPEHADFVVLNYIKGIPLARTLLARRCEEVHLVARKWIFHIVFAVY